MRNSLVALLPVLACFLGGSTAKWAEGVVIALLGLYVLIFPPGRSLGVGLNIVLCALVALLLVAFLPGSWFFEPAWRSAISNDFGIKLPNCVSPQPWVTAGCAASFIAALIWLYVVCAQDVELGDARFQLRAFAVGIVLLAAFSIGFNLLHTAPSFWINERGFGPFPNRNQTADLFGIASVVVMAAAQDDAQHRRKSWIFWALGYGVIVAAIVLNFSRAGIVIVVSATALWAVTLAFRRGSASRIAIAASVLLVLLAGILIAGGQTLERFHLRGIAGTGVSKDFRWLIFRDAWQLIHASPWCGIGLGNFESVFATFRNASLANERALHPESDWLWVWSEMGWPSVGLVIVGLFMIARFVAPLKGGSNQRFRLAAIIGAALCVLHGLIDVSGHRVGSAYAAIFLLGLSLHRPLRFRRSATAPWVFRTLAVALICTGATWTIAAQNRLLLPGSIGAANAKQAASIATHDRDFDRAIALTTRALSWAPLDWRTYFARALAEFGKSSTRSEALTDFRRARFLEPNAYELPFEEGKIWLSSRPKLAVVAWREALRRAGTHRAEMFDSMMTLATMQNRSVVPQITELSLLYHELFLVNLRRVTAAEFSDLVTRFRERDPSFQSLSGSEKNELFELWQAKGQPEALVALVSAEPSVAIYAWPAVAKTRAASGDFKGAVNLFREQHAPVPLPQLASSSDIAELQRAIATDPQNYAAGFALYKLQTELTDTDGALETARHFTSLSSSPAYFHFLEGESWSAKENWERAWTAYSRFLSATPPTPPAPQPIAR